MNDALGLFAGHERQALEVCLRELAAHRMTSIRMVAEDVLGECELPRFTLEDVEARKYTYCQFFPEPHEREMTEYTFLVPRTTAAAARPLALQHIKDKFPISANRDYSRRLYLFPRNYVKQARTLWSLGEFYPPNPPTPE